MSAVPERRPHDDLLARLTADTLKLLQRGYVPGNIASLRGVIHFLLRDGLSTEECFTVITDQRWSASQYTHDIGTAKTRAWIESEKDAIDYDAAEEPEDPCDEGELAMDTKHQPVRSAYNVRVVLRKLGAEVDYDEFANRLHLHLVGRHGRKWRGHNLDLDDAGLIALRIACAEEFGLRVGKDEFRDFVRNYAYRRRYHPVLDYLSGLEWDGKERVGNWLTTYLGVPDKEYTRAVGKLVLVAAVRRVRKPGEKFDEMLLLEGPQGGFKSAALKALAVRDEWFTDDLPLGADPKLVLERTQGCWIIEAGELSGMSKRGVADLKQFLSRPDDTARLAYDALPTRKPRSFVIVGTTNDDKYLKDLTGNRRFWPVKVGQVQLDALKRDVDQLWAEAAKLETAGAPSRLDPSLYEAAAQEQAARLEDDPWAEVLREKLVAYPNARVRSADVWAVLGKPTEQQTPQDGTRLHRLLRHLGFENKGMKHPEEAGNKTVRCWVRGDGSQPLKAVTSEPRARHFRRRDPALGAVSFDTRARSGWSPSQHGCLVLDVTGRAVVEPLPSRRDQL